LLRLGPLSATSMQVARQVWRVTFKTFMRISGAGWGRGARPPRSPENNLLSGFIRLPQVLSAGCSRDLKRTAAWVCALEQAGIRGAACPGAFNRTGMGNGHCAVPPAVSRDGGRESF
jgi:hypothetical protein